MNDALPFIDVERCNGCGECVRDCPESALVMVAAKAIIALPKKCTYCTACEGLCPERAIRCPYEIVMGPVVN